MLNQFYTNIILALTTYPSKIQILTPDTISLFEVPLITQVITKAVLYWTFSVFSDKWELWVDCDCWVDRVSIVDFEQVNTSLVDSSNLFFVAKLHFIMLLCY